MFDVITYAHFLGMCAQLFCCMTSLSELRAFRATQYIDDCDRLRIDAIETDEPRLLLDELHDVLRVHEESPWYLPSLLFRAYFEHDFWRRVGSDESNWSERLKSIAVEIIGSSDEEWQIALDRMHAFSYWRQMYLTITCGFKATLQKVLDPSTDLECGD
jgi:hypothetical protein